MAKKATAPSEGHSLVIVESPAKARTISKFLGKGYTVEASIGHIRDLPQGKKEMPADLKDEEWAKLGVNVNDRFTPVYVVPQDKKSHITKLKKLLKESQNLYLATDEDREGEAISWHLQEVLKPKVPVHRLVFHEITNEAILNALETPREIDDGLVKAQETRRILDRLYGYEISEFLWRKKLGRSAGRVQSVAVRLIVQREWERRAFRSATYWDLMAKFSTSDGQSFDATLVSVDGRKIPSGKDFDSATGQIKDPGFMLMDETGAQQLLQKLKTGTFAVTKMQVKPYTQKPAAPFTTSTMQQEANRKLGFTARRTMSAAQSLYENGYITYMRTDSTSLAKIAVDAARELVGEEYGKDYLPEEPRTYRSTVRNAQEAHEAIRPAGNPFRLPDSLKGELAPDQFKLFELIWKRTVASQMQNARGRRVTITVEGEGSVFQVSGKTIDFPGFLRAYVEGADDPNAELADKETLLPAVEEGQAVSLKEVDPKSHTTQPPSRFREAALTRELEQRGIGRPSTYASIIETIQTRNYVFKKGNALVPTWNAFSMVRLMEEHFPSLVDYEFTANMEGLLDSISRQEAGNIEYLEEFYFGKETPGLKGRLETKIKEVDPRAISTFPLGTPEEGEHLEVVNLRVGQYGPYLEQGERKASLPEDLPPDELTLESALELLKKAETGDEPLGICPDTHKPVFVKSGRFGPYVQLGLADEGEKPKNAGLLKGMSVEDITLEVALKLLSLPRQVGEHPDSKEVIEAFNGRYGPYIKCGSETRSLPDDVSPLDVQLEQALFLLSQPKRRGRSAPKEPIKTFESSPITEQPIRLLEGRYGPYVTDGETNASLPKGTETET
ncbi:MAG: type I DNA topoisomerase, partial [Planctomycetota bacterium]|nr:type I DNA topoisomerase [Planctomycetota bacterium]